MLLFELCDRTNHITILGCHACNVSSLGFHCLKLHMQLFWYSTNLCDLMDALVISIWYESDYTLIKIIKIMRSDFKTIKKCYLMQQGLRKSW